MIDEIPLDGTEARVKIGTRWYSAAWCENVDTGARFIGVKLNGSDYVPVAADAICQVRQIKRQADRSRAAKTIPPAEPLEAIKVDALVAFDELEDRIVAMVRTLRYMADSEARFLTAGSRVNWPATVYTAEDIRAQAENHDNRDSAARPPRHKPSPADLAQLDEAFAWFSALDPLDAKQRAYLIKANRLPLSSTQMLIWRHALGQSFKTIARETGEHHETIRRRYIRSIERLHAIADAELEQRIRSARGAARRVG